MPSPSMCCDCDCFTFNSDCICDNCKEEMVTNMVKSTSTGEPMDYLPSENASSEGSSE